MIINGELQTGLGGGVCQVSTTVFNAAYEAGLPITARTNHALYISHYPLGRDATVNYPDVDLKFVNDTGHWLLLRTFVGSSSLTVTLYGTPQHRRVETIERAARVTARAARSRRRSTRRSKPGRSSSTIPGAPAQSTSVERKVYTPSGKLLSDATWYSSYRSTPKIVRVGPKKAKPGGDHDDQDDDHRHHDDRRHDGDDSDDDRVDSALAIASLQPGRDAGRAKRLERRPSRAPSSRRRSRRPSRSIAYS